MSWNKQWNRNDDETETVFNPQDTGADRECQCEVGKQTNKQATTNGHRHCQLLFPDTPNRQQTNKQTNKNSSTHTHHHHPFGCSCTLLPHTKESFDIRRCDGKAKVGQKELVTVVEWSHRWTGILFHAHLAIVMNVAVVALVVLGCGLLWFSTKRLEVGPITISYP